MIETWKVLLAFALVFAAMGIVGHMDYEDEKREIEQYCHMRALWEQSKDIEPRFRPGWPNYKPEVKCDGV